MFCAQFQKMGQGVASAQVINFGVGMAAAAEGTKTVC